MRVIGPFSSGAAVGADGVATANATTTTPIVGLVVAVHVAYLGSPPAGTTDATVATSGTSHPAMTILALANAATDGWFFPRADACQTNGTATTTYNELIPIHDFVTVTIAGANAADYITIYLMVE